MIKILFVVGQCIRALSTDPWEAPTYKILEVGKYSYDTRDLTSTYAIDHCTISFKEQEQYEVVECPEGFK